MKLYIDIREEALYQKCYELLENNRSLVELVHIPLDLGDAMLELGEGQHAIIYERKCLADLVASIKDGRYEEQSYRLLNACDVHRHNIIYIVEGVLHQMRNPAEKKMVMSAITSLMVFKGFSVMRTVSVGDTADFIVSNVLKIAKDLEKGKQFAFRNGTGAGTGTTVATIPPIENEKDAIEEHLGENENTGGGESGGNAVDNDGQRTEEIKPYCHVVKKVKKDNITPENIGEIILCQIPSISAVNAVQIMKKYGGSLYELMNALKNDSGALDDMKIEGAGGKTRKMSKAVVENLRKYLVCSTQT